MGDRFQTAVEVPDVLGSPSTPDAGYLRYFGLNKRPVARNSDGEVFELAMRLPARQVFTASGIYTPTAGAKFIHVICIGGGGGSGGCGGSEVSSGGSGGNCAESWLVASPQTVTVGAGGTAGAAGNNAGGNGGITYFGSLVIAGGGLGSGGNSHGGRVAADLTSNVGQVLYRGSPGGVAQAANYSGAGGACGGYPRGHPLGLVSNGAGNPADANSGAGGSGAMAGLLGSNPGGGGGTGICIITEYF